MAVIIKQNSRAWKWRKASQKKGKLHILRKIGVNCARNNQRYWQYVKKHAKKQEACSRIPWNPDGWKSINLPQRQCNRYCSSPRHPFNNDTINGEIKLSTQTSFMEKRTVQRKKSRLKGIITSCGWHKPSPKKLLWANLLKITML